MLVVPFLKTEGQLIKYALSGNDPREKSAAEHLQAIILVSNHCQFLLNGVLSALSQESAWYAFNIKGFRPQPAS